MRPTHSDDDLLRLTLAGDQEAFLALYRRRQGGIYRFALHMSGDPGVAEEVTQEVFMALIQGGGHYDAARGSLAAFLYGMARNHVLRRLERDRRYVPLREESSEEGGRGGWNGTSLNAQDPLAELTRADLIGRVRQAVLALPVAYREVVVLCDLEELDYAQAAGLLGCPVGTVRSRLHRARTLLTEKLRALQQPGLNLRPTSVDVRGRGAL
jgi:RNA polymerase sigma-70 factor, ECF subfamily